MERGRINTGLYAGHWSKQKGIAIGMVNSWWCEFSGACSYPDALVHPPGL
jgi:hypothetical protein